MIEDDARPAAGKIVDIAIAQVVHDGHARRRGARDPAT